MEGRRREQSNRHPDDFCPGSKAVLNANLEKKLKFNCLLFCSDSSIIYLVAAAGGDANNPTNAPTAAEPNAVRTSGVVLLTETSQIDPKAAVTASMPSTITAIRKKIEPKKFKSDRPS
jgi:hypothetical protein